MILVVRTKAGTYQIPEAWMMGYMQAHPKATIGQAVAWWEDQERLEKEWQNEHANR